MGLSIKRFVSWSSFLLITLVFLPFVSLWLDAWHHFSALWSLPQVEEPNYTVQVFHSDPVMIYIKNFLSKDEITHILQQVDARESQYEESRIWNDDIGQVDTKMRISQSAIVPPDAISRRVEKRARNFIGWRNNSTYLQPLKTQRYYYNGFYNFHYDWVNEDLKFPGNRMTTLMVYLEADCTGGGTNFPRVARPVDTRWCGVIACEGDDEYKEYPGVTFKPIAGSAIFWENFHSNGTPHTGTRHAALPVRSGHKTGLNIWSWDVSWRDLNVYEDD